MALEKRVFLIALLITVIVFISILFSNSLLGNKREDVVIERMNKLIKDYEDMQALLILSEFFGDQAICIGLSSALSQMNEDLWELGIKIDQYREVTEGFVKDPFYVEQKVDFNRKEVLYLSMLKKMNKICTINQTVISYFYRKKELCQRCDDQSFVLSDIRRDLEKNGKTHELAIFSFDVDMELPTINLLIRFYNVSEYPCMVIDEDTMCGLFKKQQLLDIICSKHEISVC